MENEEYQLIEKILSLKDILLSDDSKKGVKLYQEARIKQSLKIYQRMELPISIESEDICFQAYDFIFIH